MRDPRSIVITGASSGIGEALALLYAAPGVALALTGRDAGRLLSVADRCRERGARVTAAPVDVTDRDGLARWLLEVDGETPVELLIANAGVSAGTGHAGESEAQARQILEINVTGVLNTLHPLIPAMRARGRGQLAIVSSLAAFRGVPGAPAYCASKAAVRVYGEALRGELAPAGIGVTVICPGFVKSRMTARNPFPMPFLMETEAAARRIRAGLASNAARLSFPFPLVAAVWLFATLPAAWTDRLLRLLPHKPAADPPTT